MTNKQAYILKTNEERFHRLEAIASGLNRQTIKDPVLWFEIAFIKNENFIDDLELFIDEIPY